MTVTALWSTKGGQGTTVMAAVLAQLTAHQGGKALLVDLAGDVPAVLGMAHHQDLGVTDWLEADVDPGPLSRLEVDAGSGLRVVPAGGGDGRRHRSLIQHLLGDSRPVIVDCGTNPTDAAIEVAAGAPTSLLVIRGCYIALRRAAVFPLRPTGFVFVDEPRRVLTVDDVTNVLGVPCMGVVSHDPDIARTVDAGTLTARLPRRLARELRQMA